MRKAMLCLACALAFCAGGLATAKAQEEPVDLELILAVDVSRSMDFDEMQLQRDGYVAAIRHPDFIAAISQGLHGKIALSYIEWAGIDQQHVTVDWRIVDGAASANAFAAALAAQPVQAYRGTSIGSSLAYVAPRFEGNGYAGLRRVIDVSGDGPNNMGIPVEVAREPVIRSGITINGLPIMIKAPGGFASIANLDVYYEDCVIGGPGAFLIAVRSPEEFAIAIKRKLVLEIVGAEPRVVPAAETVQQRRIDCLIGEKLREQWMRE
jgi:hypothetical protein